MFVRNHGRMFFLCYSLVQLEDANLRGHYFVLVLIAFSLGVDDLLVFDPLALDLFRAHSRLLLHSDQCFGLEVVLLSIQNARLHHRPRLMLLL